MSTVTLTISEVTASAGSLCWRSQRHGMFPGLACSLPFGHPDLIVGCRYDMKVRDKLPRARFWRVVLTSAAINVTAGVALTMLWLARP